jgi:two-component sensor histidine kinase
MIYPIDNLEDANILAQAIVNTIPEPFLVLDAGLRVLSASRSFYATFKVDAEETRGQLLYALGDGQWDIPALRTLLETIIPDRVAMDGFEVEHDFPGIGRKTMMLNARKVIYQDSKDVTILLAFQDVSVRRAIELEREAVHQQSMLLLQQSETMFEEMRHRVANSLQIIASILMLKARAVSSEETRVELQDAHQRVMSVATVQQHLHETPGIDQVNVKTYFEKLCAGLASSMVSDIQPVAIDVLTDDGMIASGKAISLGLIVTELVINALKYAFPLARADGRILVTYETDGANWNLIVSDNGVGKSDEQVLGPNSGLGTSIVKALAKQLDARLDTQSKAGGLTVAVSHAVFSSRMPLAN